MSKVSCQEVAAALEGPVSITAERRGFETRRGVPDSVFWLAPASERIECRPLPVLVELEGSFGGAADDFEKFASRYDDEEFQYHLEWPVVGTTGRESIQRRARYDIIGIRANQVAAARSISEREMHQAFSSWFDKFQSAFEVTTRIRRHGSTEIVWWEIEYVMFGHRVETGVPFVVTAGEEIEEVLEHRIPSSTVPGVVVVNGKYDGRSATTAHHRTTIELPPIRPIRFR